MALAAVSNTLRDMYLLTRPGISPVAPTAVYDGLVSDLQPNDWLIGPRQYVLTALAPTGNPATRTLTLRRANAVDTTVVWPSASGIRFAR